MKDVGIPRQAQWQRHCQNRLYDVSTATRHKEKQEWCNRGGEQRRKGEMVQEGKQKGKQVKWGSVLLHSPPVRPKVEVQGNAALAQVAGIRLLQNSRHCTSLSPGCDFCSDAENLQREYILHLLTSASSKPPSLTSCADLPVDPQHRRPTVPSHATICPLTSFSLQHCSGARETLLRGTTYFPLFFPLLMEHRSGKQGFCSSHYAWAASFSQGSVCWSLCRSALVLVKQEEIWVPLISGQQDVSDSAYRKTGKAFLLTHTFSHLRR